MVEQPDGNAMTDLETHDAPLDKARLYRQLRWATTGLSLMLVIMVVVGIVLWDNEEIPGWVFVVSAGLSVPAVALFHFGQRRSIRKHDGRPPTADQKVFAKKWIFWTSAILLAMLANGAVTVTNMVTDFSAGPGLFVVLILVAAVLVISTVRLVQLFIAARKVAKHHSADS